MKKIGTLIRGTLVILCLSICLFMGGCYKESFNFKFSQESQSVVSMRIYYVSGEDFDREIGTAQLLELEPIREIDEKDYEEVMDKIESFTFDFGMLLIAPAPSPSFGFYGIVLYIEYEDGGFSVLDDSTRMNFDKDGQKIDTSHQCLYGYSEEFHQFLQNLAGENLNQ